MDRLYTSKFSDVFANENMMEIHWKPESSELNEDSFKEEISAFANSSGQSNPSSIFVNAIEYGFSITIELQNWHDENIIPQYTKAGVRKMAFILPQDLVTQLSIEQTFDENQAKSRIQVQYFSDELEAKSWLNK